MIRAPSPDGERTFACAHCPKRYSRKDYLERHELNHSQPGSVCPACGKGFARPDVLRKHLSTSCKSRRNDGDVAPLTSAEEDALVPRKRRRPQRRATGSSSSRSPSTEGVGRVPRAHPYAAALDRDRPERYAPERLNLDDAYYYDYDTGRRDSNSSLPTTSQPNSAASLNPSPMSSALAGMMMANLYRGSPEPTAFQSRLEVFRRQAGLPALHLAPMEEATPGAPGRVGASLEIPLAPAFAATPETLGPLFGSNAASAAASPVSAPLARPEYEDHATPTSVTTQLSNTTTNEQSYLAMPELPTVPEYDHMDLFAWLQNAGAGVGNTAAPTTSWPEEKSDLAQLCDPMPERRDDTNMSTLNPLAFSQLSASLSCPANATALNAAAVNASALNALALAGRSREEIIQLVEAMRDGHCGQWSHKLRVV